MAVSKKVSSNPLPISFKEFAAKPVAGVAFLCIVGISYLFIDIKNTFKEQALQQGIRIQRLEYRDSLKTESIRQCDSSLSATTSKLKTLSELGKIK
jgi:hypothetical protein